MSKLTVMVGLPGAGKSTYAQTLIDGDGHIKIVSTDQIRKEQGLTDHAPVWDIAYQRTVNLLKEETDVIFDATMLSSRRRRGLINFCRTALKGTYLEIEAIIVWAPIATCIERRKAFRHCAHARSIEVHRERRVHRKDSRKARPRARC